MRREGEGKGELSLSLNLTYECENDATRIDYECENDATRIDYECESDDRKIEAPFIERYSTPSYTPFFLESRKSLHAPEGYGSCPVCVSVCLWHTGTSFNCPRNQFRASTLKTVSLEPVQNEATCRVGFIIIVNVVVPHESVCLFIVFRHHMHLDPEI